MTDDRGNDARLRAIADDESIKQPLVDDAKAKAEEERIALATEPADDEPDAQHPPRTA